MYSYNIIIEWIYQIQNNNNVFDLSQQHNQIYMATSAQWPLFLVMADMYSSYILSYFNLSTNGTSSHYQKLLPVVI